MKSVYEVEKLSELWKHPTWKEKVNSFIENKSCEWCGRKVGDTYTDRKGKKRTVGLAPHHIERHKWGLPLYKQIVNELFRKWYKPTQTIYDVPRSLSKRESRDYVKNLWTNDNRDLIQEHFAEAKKKIIDTYIELDKENIIILCTRCHYAREKGLLICPVCRTNYRKKQYPTCYNCRGKA